jgi:hypothetical protein
MSCPTPPAEPKARLAATLGELLIAAASAEPALASGLAAQLQAFTASVLPASAAGPGAPAAMSVDGEEGAAGGAGGVEGLLEAAAAGKGAGLLAASAVVQGGDGGRSEAGRAWR